MYEVVFYEDSTTRPKHQVRSKDITEKSPTIWASKSEILKLCQLPVFMENCVLL
jgi:hypothetical protein